MLFKKTELEKIVSGEIRLAFRRWVRPAVRTGGTLLTPAGQLAIEAVDPVSCDEISEADAKAAGYPSLKTLQTTLEQRSTKTLYRIRFRVAGSDPRIALGKTLPETLEEQAEIQDQLKRLDTSSKTGPWTSRLLKAIEKHPHIAAQKLSDLTGDEKEWLKTHVRKLKNLGLTLSHQPGYELSPRGSDFLKGLAENDQRIGEAPAK